MAQRGKTNNYKKIKPFLYGILSFFLTILLSVIFLWGGSMLGFLNRKPAAEETKKNSYFQETYSEFIRSANEITIASGLSEEIVGEVIPLQTFYVRGNKNLEKSQITNATELQEINKSLNELWSDAITEKEGLLSKQDEAAIKQCADNIVKLYEQYSTLPLLNQIDKFRDEVQQGSVILIPIIVISVIIMLVLTFGWHYKHKGIRYIVYAVISADLIVWIAGTYIFFNRFEMIPEASALYSNILLGYFMSGVRGFYSVGVLGAGFAAILLVVIHFMKDKIVKKHS